MKILQENEFDKAIEKGIVLVDFFANWCGPCRMMAPILESVEEELDYKINFYKIDVDECENIAKRYGIMSIPTIIIFRDGEIIEKNVGLWQKDACLDTIKKYL